MFIEKSETEVILLENDIKVVGLNLQRSGLSITFESLGTMWESFSDEVKETIKDKDFRMIEYGISLNKVPDYIVGCGVNSFEGNKDQFFQHTIPAGSYIKDLFNAETFEQLVTEAISKRDVKKYAKEKKLKIDRSFMVEVYPDNKRKHPEMYTLTPIVVNSTVVK